MGKQPETSDIRPPNVEELDTYNSYPMSKPVDFLKDKPLLRPEQSYLIGLRGFLVIQGFLWIFLQTFVPAAVKDSNNPDGPKYQVMLRKTLSVLFWNESLIYSAIILLSARSLPIPFLNRPHRLGIASVIFRRGLRLWFPTAVGLALVYGIFSATGLKYISDFAQSTGNNSLIVPYEIPNVLAFFNIQFDIFWVTHMFSQQAAAFAWPGQTLWIVTAIFQQSFTVYATMLTIPYTRKLWQLVGGFCFIVTAWWVQSWAWYTITGLYIANVVMNMDFKKRSKAGIPVGRWQPISQFEDWRFPSWIVYTFLCTAGLVMQYLWTAWKPDLENAEIRIHTGEYYTGGLNTNFILGAPEARDDNYLFLLGAFLFLETTDWLQMVFRNPVFVYLGRRSFSTYFSSFHSF